MIKFSIGCNFDERLLDGICLLNEQNSIRRITQFYGAVRAHAAFSARPAYRLPDISLKQLKAFIAKSRESGIEFNYSLNTIYPGSKQEVNNVISKVRDLIKTLIDCGVSRIAVATPLIAKIIREVSTEVQIEVSTIAHIDTITQIKIWKSHFDISSICGNLLKNRSVEFLRRAASYCRENGIAYSVMVNEFCVAGNRGDEVSATHCIYRDSCYLCHAENITVDDDLLLGQYPMSSCIASRSMPATWLKAHFIRPEDVQRYVDININNFKITGRTATTGYLLTVAKAYLEGHWSGNLLSLWKNLETIPIAGDEMAFAPCHYIDNKRLGVRPRISPQTYNL